MKIYNRETGFVIATYLSLIPVLFLLSSVAAAQDVRTNPASPVAEPDNLDVHPTRVEITKPETTMSIRVGSARMSNIHKAMLDHVAHQSIQEPFWSIVVDGHRDSSERPGLSLTRANNARDYLVTARGIDAARITVRDIEDTCPHESGNPALSRRIEVWLLSRNEEVKDMNKRCLPGNQWQVVSSIRPALSIEYQSRSARSRASHKARRPAARR